MKNTRQQFIHAIEKLNQRLNIPKHISGIRKEDIKQMAKHAAIEANPLYPVPTLMDAQELEALYRLAADWSKKDD